MWLSLFNGLDVLYHHAKFGEDRTTRSGCRCGNMVFICFCFCFSVCISVTLRVRRALCLGVTYFEQVLRHSLQVDFDTVVTFSQGIAVSDAINSSHFLLLVAPQFSRNCGRKLRKVQKSAEKFVRKIGNFQLLLGPRSHPRAPIGVKFCKAKRTHVPLGCAKFRENRCNESPVRGENADIQPVSKFNTWHQNPLPFKALCIACGFFLLYSCSSTAGRKPEILHLLYGGANRKYNMQLK